MPTTFVVRFPCATEQRSRRFAKSVTERDAANNRVVTAKRQTLERELTKAHGRKQHIDIDRQLFRGTSSGLRNSSGRGLKRRVDLHGGQSLAAICRFTQPVSLITQEQRPGRSGWPRGRQRSGWSPCPASLAHALPRCLTNANVRHQLDLCRRQRQPVATSSPTSCNQVRLRARTEGVLQARVQFRHHAGKPWRRSARALEYERELLGRFWEQRHEDLLQVAREICELRPFWMLLRQW